MQLVAVSSTGPPLHAATLDTDKVIVSLNSISARIVGRRPRAGGQGQFITTLHGALRTYDLGDLRDIVP